MSKTQREHAAFVKGIDGIADTYMKLLWRTSSLLRGWGLSIVAHGSQAPGESWIDKSESVLACDSLNALSI